MNNPREPKRTPCKVWPPYVEDRPMTRGYPTPEVVPCGSPVYRSCRVVLGLLEFLGSMFLSTRVGLRLHSPSSCDLLHELVHVFRVYSTSFPPVRGIRGTTPWLTVEKEPRVVTEVPPKRYWSLVSSPWVRTECLSSRTTSTIHNYYLTTGVVRVSVHWNFLVSHPFLSSLRLEELPFR